MNDVVKFEAVCMAPRVVQTDLPFTVMSMEADTDYLLARMIHFLGVKFHSRSGWFAQQACEKYMKAVMIDRSRSYSETHNLKELAVACEPYDPIFGELETKRILQQFDMFDQVGRYGGAANFDPLSKGQAVGGWAVTLSFGVQIAGATVWTNKHLDDLDAFVFKTRPMLDYAKHGFDDSLNSILENNKRSAHVDSWRGPVALRTILTRENRSVPR